jgi:predicted dehydrogenase
VVKAADGFAELGPSLSPGLGLPGVGARVAVLGTGSAGMRHLQVLRDLAEVPTIAVPKRLTRIDQLEKAGYSTALDLDQAIRKGANLCIVATDTSSHVEDGLAAIEHGLDVLVEKPLATNAAGARRLNQGARQAGRSIFTACVLRFSESLNTFRGLLDEAGCLHSVRIECQSYLPDWRPGRSYQDSYSARSDAGGVLRDLIHEIDYATWLYGWPASVHASLRNLGRLGIAAEELAELTWDSPAGCVVSMSLDYLSRPPRRRMRASGDRGTLEWDAIAGTVTLMVDGTPDKVIRSTQTRDEMFAAQACAFINVVGGMCDPRLASGDDGGRALAVCDAARCSSSSRREERVEYL